MRCWVYRVQEAKCSVFFWADLVCVGRPERKVDGFPCASYGVEGSIEHWRAKCIASLMVVLVFRIRTNCALTEAEVMPDAASPHVGALCSST